MIDGVSVHFLHVRSPHAEALPLVLTHGWPGSIIEFLKVIGPLTDPTAHGGNAADAFHLVCPSLPGYGFSDKPTRLGWGVARIAAAWTVLMGRLGYERYGAQGSDWGTSISTSVGQQDPDHVAGIHLTPPLAPPEPATFDDLTERERAALASLEHAAEWDSGYSQEQGTRPQTIGYALVDSPTTLCAWIWESIRQVNAWISGSTDDTVTVPTGCSIFPKERRRPSRRWAEKRFLDIRHWNEPDRGGHFAAFGQPELFVDEVRAFFRHVR